MPCFICEGNLTKDEDGGIYCTDCNEEYVMVESVKKLEKSVVTFGKAEYVHWVRCGDYPCYDGPVIVQKCNLKIFVERSPEERQRLDARNVSARQRRFKALILNVIGEIFKNRETPN